MSQETSSACPGSIDEATFTIFSMAFYVLLDTGVLSIVMAYRQHIPVDSGQVMGVIILAWYIGWFAATIRMNRIWGLQPGISPDVADKEALRSLVLGAILQLPIPVLLFAVVPAGAVRALAPMAALAI